MKTGVQDSRALASVINPVVRFEQFAAELVAGLRAKGLVGGAFSLTPIRDMQTPQLFLSPDRPAVVIRNPVPQEGCKAVLFGTSGIKTANRLTLIFATEAPAGERLPDRKDLPTTLVSMVQLFGDRAGSVVQAVFEVDLPSRIIRSGQFNLGLPGSERRGNVTNFHTKFATRMANCAAAALQAIGIEKPNRERRGLLPPSEGSAFGRALRVWAEVCETDSPSSAVVGVAADGAPDIHD